MRKIKLYQILTFLALLTICIGLAAFSTCFLLGTLTLGDFRGVILTATGLALSFIYAIVAYRLALCLFHLPEGEIPIDSREESIYHLHLLFFLIVFYPIMRSALVPVPLMKVVYLALGARLGKNTFSGGVIFDPIFVEAGANTLIGQGALLIPHVIEGSRLAHYRICIGNNVTIGAHAVVLADVTIEDEAIVAVGAVIPKGTRIARFEIWGGVPAKKIGVRLPLQSLTE